MNKTVLLFWGLGMAIGAAIGFATNNLAVGMGVGAALGIVFARRYKVKHNN